MPTIASLDELTWIPPMLATLTESSPRGEVGLRAQARRRAGAHLRERSDACACTPATGSSLNDAYPELVEALGATVRGDAVLDGEVVAFDPERGITSFARLQQRMQLRDPVRARRSQVDVYLYLFDCMYYEGIDLTGLPLLERKSVLEDAVEYDDPIRLTPFRTRGLPRCSGRPAPSRRKASWPNGRIHGT